MDIPSDAVITEGYRRKDITGQRYGRLKVVQYVYSRLIGQRKDHTPYWLCICDCGENKIISGASLRNKNTLSCGCLNQQRRTESGINRSGKQAYNHLADGEAALNALYRRYQRGATERLLSFSLSREEFRILINGDCFYCGVPPYKELFNSSKEPTSITWNGIDRKNNLIGYETDNVVSCCERCNRFKKNRDVDQFLNLIKKIYENLQADHAS